MAAPAIDIQPQSATVNANQPASFTIVATGGGTLRYQWARNGTAIAGADGATYALAAAQLSDSGASFAVTVANASGSVTSAVARLTVNAIASNGATAQRLFSDQSLWNARPTRFSLGTFQIPTSSYYPLISKGAYSVTGAIASNTDASMTVTGINGQGVWVPDAEVSVTQVVIPHWPASVTPAAGTDGHADIIDAANNRIHSFWQLSQDSNGAWHAAQYTWTALDGTGWGTPGEYMQGSRAAGVVPIAGIIRANEVNDGQQVYKHALAMSLTFNALASSPTFVFPATSADSDAAWANTGQIPEGARMMLPANFDTTGITNASLLKVIRTLQTYGAYVVDRNYGTPFEIYVENTADFSLMPNGWDNTIAAQLDQMRAALRQVVDVTEWVDATGAVFTPDQNLNLLSMRGAWALSTGTTPGAFDTLLQAVVFPANGQVTSQWNSTGRSVPSFLSAGPSPGQRFRIRVTATGGATARLTINGPIWGDTGWLGDGADVILTWPNSWGFVFVGATSGPQGGGQVSATMTLVPN